MNQEKVLKIIRGLNSFSPDDILMMCDSEEKEIKNILENLLSEKIIQKISDDDYIYLGKAKLREDFFKLIEAPVKKDIKEIPEIKFIQAADYFLMKHVKENCTFSTFKTYKSLIKTHLIQFFGKMELQNINQNHIKDFIKLKQEEKLSDKRINDTVVLFGTMFSKFIEWELIGESPYLGMINIKFERKNNIKILNGDEKSKLLTLSKKNYSKLYLMILLILSAGIKKGEILALQKSDINIENKKIHINKTLYEDKIVPIRFKSAMREVNLPESILFELMELLKNKNNEDLIFDKQRLSHFTCGKHLRIAFAKLLKQIGIEKILFNDLRHTYAFDTLQSGKSIDYLHKQLGDYSIQATMDRYGNFILA